MVGSRASFVFVKMLVGAIAMLGFVWLLLVGSLESGAAETSETRTVSVRSMANLKHEEAIGREKLVYNPELDLNYMMSKRKVPNGPDPIHNRRAGNSKRPPGQV